MNIACGEILAVHRNIKYFLPVELDIGAWYNRQATIKPCYYKKCSGIIALHEEEGLVDINEYRPFWIEYREGVVKVGKGGQKEAFLEWDAGAYHKRVSTPVNVGIASWRNGDHADWIFHQFCG